MLLLSLLSSLLLLYYVVLINCGRFAVVQRNEKNEQSLLLWWCIYEGMKDDDINDTYVNTWQHTKQWHSGFLYGFSFVEWERESIIHYFFIAVALLFVYAMKVIIIAVFIFDNTFEHINFAWNEFRIKWNVMLALCSCVLCDVQIKMLNSLLYHLRLRKRKSNFRLSLSLSCQYTYVQSSLLFDDDKTMEIIYSFWRQNHFITFNKCYMPSYHHHHRHSAVLVLVVLLIQSLRPNGWLTDWLDAFLTGWLTVLKTVHTLYVYVCENSQWRIKCSVKFTLAYYNTWCGRICAQCALCAHDMCTQFHTTHKCLLNVCSNTHN